MRSSAFLLLVLVLVALYTTAASATSAARITTTPRDPHGALARAMHARRAMNHAQARAQANLPAVSPHPLPTARNPLDDTLIAQQVHASLGYSQADTYINYVTFDKADVSFVRYGLSPDALDSEATATQTLFVDEGTAHINRWMHEALLPNLQLGVTYYYQVHVDSRANVSALNVYQYKTIAADLGFERPLRIAMFGDFGLINGQSHDALVQEVQNGTIDMIVHAGDMAYNLDDYNGTRGDQFMQREEPVASALPYMVCPGNHESQQNFSHYRHRFHMPGDESGTNTNLFSSFNVGPVHFVSVSDEMYFYPESYSMDSLKMQYEWLIQDLFAANTPEARAVRPWIIVYAHRPMYCTPDTNDDPSICTTDTQRVRQGTNFNGGEAMYGLEDVLMEFKVDFFFSGHMHSYERLYAVYNNTLLSESYHNMESPLHIVAGAAGCQEDLDHYGTEIPEWSAVRSDSYGYGKLHVYNATHMYWEQILDLNGAVLDSVWVTKDPYPFAAQVVEQATVVA